MTFTALIAEDPPKEPGKDQPKPEQPFYMTMPFMIAMFGLFFLVVILPQSRRKNREAKKMIESLKAGARVVTASGIVGSVVKIKDGGTEVVIRSEDTKLCVLKTAITSVIAEETPEVKS